MRRAALVVDLVFMAGLWATAALASPPDLMVETLLETDTTILGQEFEYPTGTAKITALLLTVPPQATVPLHEHPVPLFAYLLQGELTVEYDEVGPVTYRAGDAFVEAFEWPHRAHNAGRGMVKLLAVYAGADGVPNSVPLPDDRPPER